MHHRSTDGMQIELGDVRLPIEKIVEISVPVDEDARPGGIEVVVIAVESGMAVIAHINVGAACIPQDVVANLDVARRRLDMNVVASGSIKRIADQAHVILPMNEHAVLNIAIDEVVSDE